MNTRFELIVRPSSVNRETFYEIFNKDQMITTLVLTNKAKALQVLQRANNGDLTMLYELSLKYVKQSGRKL